MPADMNGPPPYNLTPAAFSPVNSGGTLPTDLSPADAKVFGSLAALTPVNSPGSPYALTLPLSLRSSNIPGVDDLECLAWNWLPAPL